MKRNFSLIWYTDEGKKIHAPGVMDGKAEIVAEACDHSAWSHCFSDDTLIIWYTLYRIYVSWCDGTDNKFRCKNVFYTLFLKSRDVDGPTTISCYFLYIYIYITRYIIWLVSMFLMFLVGGCSVSMWYYNIDYTVISRAMSVVRYSCCCYRLMWRQPSRVCCRVHRAWLPVVDVLVENPFFFFFFNFSYLSFFFLLLLLLHIGIYTYIY